MKKFGIFLLCILVLPTVDALIGARQYCKNGVVILYSPGGTGKPGSLELKNHCMVSVVKGIEDYFNARGYSVEYLDLYRDYGIIPLDPIEELSGIEIIGGKVESTVGAVSDMFVNYMGSEKFLKESANAVSTSISEDKCVLFLGRSNGAAFIAQTMSKRLPKKNYPEVNAVVFGIPNGYELDEITNLDPRIFYWEHEDDWVSVGEDSLLQMLLRFLDGEPWPAHEYSWGGDQCLLDERKEIIIDTEMTAIFGYPMYYIDPNWEPVEVCANFDELPGLVTSFLDSKYLSLIYSSQRV
jgi:hypothetical protein